MPKSGPSIFNILIMFRFGQDMADIRGGMREAWQKTKELYEVSQTGLIEVTAIFDDLGAAALKNRDALQSTAEMVVKLGADVNFCGNSEYSPLYRSIIYEHFEIFQFLIRKGAFLNKNDLSALSDLEWWEHHENTKYIEILKAKEMAGPGSMK